MKETKKSLFAIRVFAAGFCASAIFSSCTGSSDVSRTGADSNTNSSVTTDTTRTTTTPGTTRPAATPGTTTTPTTPPR